MFIIMCHVVGVGGETVIEPFMRPRGMFRGAGWLLKSDSRKQLVCGIRVLCYHLLLLSNLCGGVYRNHYRFIIRHRNKHWAIYKFVSIYIHHIYNLDYHQSHPIPQIIRRKSRADIRTTRYERLRPPQPTWENCTDFGWTGTRVRWDNTGLDLRPLMTVPGGRWSVPSPG